MRKQDYLVGLIAALGPNEKRYFRLFSGLQPGEKRYMKLFDALEKREKYESAELCTELGIEPWQLADDKHYLTQILLQSLRNYDQESTELSILRSQVENVHGLINRRAFDFALDLIDKTLERAWELEAFEIISALLVMRNSSLINSGNRAGSDMLKLHEKAARKLNEIIELTDLRGQARNLEIQAANTGQFETILAHPLLKDHISTLGSLRAKSLRYETLAHYYSAAIDVTAQLLLAREERKLYLKHPEIKIINPIVYLTNISRLANGEKDFEVSLQLVGNLQKELANPEIKISNQRRDSLNWSASLISLWNLRHLHRFKEALPIADAAYNISAGRSEYDRLSIGFEYALALLHNNKPGEAADKIDVLLRFKSDIRADMHPFIRIMHVMAQLALGNYAIIPHIIKSVRFWVKKNGSGHAEINLFLKHIGLIAKAPADKRQALNVLLLDVEAGKLQTINRLLQFDVWVDGLIKRTAV